MFKTEEELTNQIFKEKKKKQFYDGPCVAAYVDCDCDWCLRNEANKEAKRRLEEVRHYVSA